MEDYFTWDPIKKKYFPKSTSKVIKKEYTIPLQSTVSKIIHDSRPFTKIWNINSTTLPFVPKFAVISQENLVTIQNHCLKFWNDECWNQINSSESCLEEVRNAVQLESIGIPTSLWSYKDIICTSSISDRGSCAKIFSESISISYNLKNTDIYCTIATPEFFISGISKAFLVVDLNNLKTISKMKLNSDVLNLDFHQNEYIAGCRNGQVSLIDARFGIYHTLNHLYCIQNVKNIDSRYFISQSLDSIQLWDSRFLGKNVKQFNHHEGVLSSYGSCIHNNIYYTAQDDKVFGWNIWNINPNPCFVYRCNKYICGVLNTKNGIMVLNGNQVYTIHL